MERLKNRLVRIQEISQNKSKEPIRRKGQGPRGKIGLSFLKRLLELHASGMPVADAVKLLNQRLSDPSQLPCWFDMARTSGGADSLKGNEVAPRLFFRIVDLCD